MLLLLVLLLLAGVIVLVVVLVDSISESDPGIVLFDFILYVPPTIFQLNRDGSSWVEPVLSLYKCV